jgi:hypothetical protein
MLADVPTMLDAALTVTVAVARAAYTKLVVAFPVSASASALDAYKPTFPHKSESVVVMFVRRMYRTGVVKSIDTTFTSCTPE